MTYDVDDSEFMGINIVNSGFSSGLLSFDSSGKPYNNGALLIEETMLMTISGNIQIKIVPGTGHCYK